MCLCHDVLCAVGFMAGYGSVCVSSLITYHTLMSASISITMLHGIISTHGYITIGAYDVIVHQSKPVQAAQVVASVLFDIIME